MAKRIDTQARIEAVRLQEQGSPIATPAAGYSAVYAKANGLYLVNDDGQHIGPFITGSPSASTQQLIVIQDLKASGTSGGTFTAGSWQTRALNTISVDDTGAVSLGSNQITLPAGTYWVEIFAPATRVARHQARLYDITNGAVLLWGIGSYILTTNYFSQTNSVIIGKITLAGATVLEVQHRCETTFASDGFGIFIGWGPPETYTTAKFVKVA